MILGIGTDIVKIERFTNSRDRMDQLADKILTDVELKEYLALSNSHDNFLAKKWAAKEAVSKSFGTGIRGSTSWKSIEISHSELGQPVVRLQNHNDVRCHLSISDDDDTVIAYCILETNN